MSYKKSGNHTGIIIQFVILVTFLLFAAVNLDRSLVYLIVLVSGLYLNIKNNTAGFLYWAIVLIDPSRQIAFVQARGLILFLMFIPLFVNYGKYIRIIKENKLFRRFVFCALCFLFYQLINALFLYKTPGYSIYLQEIWLFGGTLLCIPAYVLFLKDRTLFIKLLISAAFTIYFLDILSIFHIINVFQAVVTERGMGIDSGRIFNVDITYLARFFVYMSLAILFFPIKKKVYQYTILAICVMAFCTLVIGMLRLDTSSILIGSIICFLLYKSKVRLGISIKRVFVIISLCLVVSFLLQNRLDSFWGLFDATSKALSGSGGVEDGSLEIRMTVWIPLLMSLFAENPVFGVGWYKVVIAPDNVAWCDMPFFSGLAIYGVAGMLLYLFRYIYVFKSLIYVLRNKFAYQRLQIELVIYFALSAFFIVNVFFRFYMTFQEVVYGMMGVDFGILFGIYFALDKTFRNEIEIYKINKGSY